MKRMEQKVLETVRPFCFNRNKMKRIDYALLSHTICNGVVQKLWFLNQRVLRLAQAETSSTYAGSYSSACSLKALTCW